MLSKRKQENFIRNKFAELLCNINTEETEIKFYRTMLGIPKMELVCNYQVIWNILTKFKKDDHIKKNWPILLAHIIRKDSLGNLTHTEQVDTRTQGTIEQHNILFRQERQILTGVLLRRLTCKKETLTHTVGQIKNNNRVCCQPQFFPVLYSESVPPSSSLP